jgi:hypothetical protein
VKGGNPMKASEEFSIFLEANPGELALVSLEQ